MDLEQLEDATQSEKMDMNVDTEALVADVEEIAELEQDVESTLKTISGLLDMESTFEKLTVADQESVTDSQLTAFRAGITSAMIASNADAKTLFGIDTESTYVDATTAFAKDVEGIKEFFKKVWAKIKAGLIKANAFFRKMFVKFLNMVSFRKGTLEKLIEDVEASTSGNETLKSSKFGIVKKLSALGVIGGNSGTAIDFKSIEGALGSGETATLSKINAAMGKFSALVKKSLKTPGSVTEDELQAAMSEVAIAGEESTLGKEGLKNAEKIDKAGFKKFKKSEHLFPVRVTGTKIYVAAVEGKKGVQGVIKVKGDKFKTLEGIKSADLVTVLKRAENTNEDFKSIVDTAFEMYDEAKTLSEAFEGINVEDDKGASEKEKAEFKKRIAQTEKAGKNFVSLSPWLAFHASMHVYKNVGYAIGVAKAYLNDSKSKDDK